jgi:hypothetical protein
MIVVESSPMPKPGGWFSHGGKGVKLKVRTWFSHVHWEEIRRPCVRYNQ